MFYDDVIVKAMKSSCGYLRISPVQIDSIRHHLSKKAFSLASKNVSGKKI